MPPRRSPDPLRVVRAAIQAGRFADALERIGTLEDAALRLGDVALFSAMALWRLGRYEESTAAAATAVQRFEASADRDGAMRAYNVQAAGQFALGDLRAARSGFARAFALADSVGDGLMSARCANNLGNVDYYLGAHDAARSHYRVAEAGFSRVGFTKGVAECLLNSCIVERARGDLSESLRLGDRAADAAAEANDPRVLGQAIAARAETRALLGDHALADREVQHAERLATETENPLDVSDALRIRSVIARRAGAPQAAVAFGLRALEIVTPLKHGWTTAEIQEDLARAHAEAGETDAARRAYQAAEATFRRLDATARADRIAVTLNAMRGNSE